VSEKRCECQTVLGLVWRETGAVPKRPSEPRLSGAHLEEDKVENAANRPGGLCLPTRRFKAFQRPIHNSWPSALRGIRPWLTPLVFLRPVCQPQ
jgi:hypothetical protein